MVDMENCHVEQLILEDIEIIYILLRHKRVTM